MLIQDRSHIDHLLADNHTISFKSAIKMMRTTEVTDSQSN
jgi:hypothetical protein